MRTARRTLLVLVVLVVVLPLAAAAGAAKPPPSTVEVEITRTGAYGLATTCEGTGSITMESVRLGYMAGVGGPEVARLAITAHIPWTRPEPGGTSVNGFLGDCYGGQASYSQADWPGTLVIYTSSAGKPTEFLWHFDHYATVEKYGPGRERTVLHDGFTLWSRCDPIDPEYEDCQAFEATETAPGSGVYDVSGTFTLYVWDRTKNPPYVFQGSSFFQFGMTISPPAR